MLLSILGILIGFVGIMLLFSLLVTAVVQAIQGITQLRFWNLSSAIAAFLSDHHSELTAKHIRQLINQKMPVQLAALPFIPFKLKMTSLSEQDVYHLVDELTALAPEDKDALKLKIRQMFPMLENIMALRFKQWMHQIAIVISFLLAFTFQLNAFDLLEKLNRDAEFREYMETYASQASQQKSAADWQSNTVNKQVLVANFTVFPQGFCYYLNGLTQQCAKHYNGKDLIRNWIGVIFAAVFISLGAPFWFNRLQDLTSLRDKLGLKHD